MNKCTTPYGLTPCYPALPRFEKPLHWPELKTKFKDLFILDKKNPCCLLDITNATESEWKDIDMIHDFAESNKLYFTETFLNPMFYYSNLPSSYIFVSVYDFNINDHTGDIYLHITGNPKTFLGKQVDHYLPGLS